MFGKNNSLFCFFEEMIQHGCGEQTQKDVVANVTSMCSGACVRACVCLCERIYMVSIYIYCCAARVKPAKRCVCHYEMFEKEIS